MMSTRSTLCRTLLVEDNPGDARLIEEMLGEVGVGTFEPRSATDLAAARALLSEREFDVVLLDLSLPDSHGTETVAAVRGIAPHMPIVVLTCLEDEEVTYDALERGAQDYLVKGQFDPAVLTRTIRYAIRRKRLEDEVKHSILLLQATLESTAKARQAAEAANRAKSEFLADLSHEIRTPLNTIVGVADLLADTKLAADQQQYVEILHRSTQVLLALVSDVLDLSKIEAGRLELEKIPFSLSQVVTGVLELLRPAAVQKSLVLAVEIPSDVPAQVVGDPTRLRQILLNLASNAIRFTEQGRVTIAVKNDAASGFLHFTVSDTGIGIRRENLAVIFEEFRQVDPSVQRHYGGSGLGLGIARRLVELMRGRIWVESEIGSGSRFHFVVHLDPAPRGSEAEQPQLKETGRAGDDSPPAKTQARILLADDSEDNRALIGFYLKKTRYEIEMADNGEVAVLKFKSGQYDLVIMDLQMPVLDGYEAVRQIRRWEAENRRPPTPILALTAYAIDEKIAKSLEGGCNGFLTKPVTKEQLLTAIQSYVQAKSPAA